MFFVFLRAWNKEKLRSPHEESSLISSDSIFEHRSTKSRGLGFDSLWRPRIFFLFFFSRSWQDEQRLPRHYFYSKNWQCRWTSRSSHRRNKMMFARELLSVKLQTRSLKFLLGNLLPFCLFVCLFVCFSSNLRSFIIVFSFKITTIFSDSKYHDLLLQKDTTWHRASVQFTKGWQLNEISYSIHDFSLKISHIYFLLQLSATFPSPLEKYKCMRQVFTPKMINHLIYSWHNGKNGWVCNDSCFNSILS